MKIRGRVTKSSDACVGGWCTGCVAAGERLDIAPKLARATADYGKMLRGLLGEEKGQDLFFPCSQM